MRVAIIAESFLPQVNGVVNSILRVCDHLQARGDEAIIIAAGTHETPAEVNGFRVHALPSLGFPGYHDVRVSLTPTFAYEDILEEFNPDVVHVAAPFVVGYRGLIAAARMGIPSVAIYQTDVANYARMYGYSGITNIIWRRLYDMHSLATLTLAPSSFSIDQLASHGIPRLAIWGRGVDVVKFDPAKRSEELRATYAAHGETIVGYVGRLAPEKRVEDFAHLVDIPGTSFVIVGGGPSLDALRKAMPDAHFTGTLKGEDLARTYASMDVFVTPGELETFGQTIQEAMASGLPVIAPRMGGPIDLIAPGQDGYTYTPGDMGMLRTQVTSLVGDPAKRQRMAQAARARVENRTWSNVCDDLIGYYEQAIASRARALTA